MKSCLLGAVEWWVVLNEADKDAELTLQPAAFNEDSLPPIPAATPVYCHSNSVFPGFWEDISYKPMGMELQAVWYQSPEHS